MKVSEALDVLGALAQQSRLAVFRYLIRTGPGGAPAGQIATELDVHVATLSFHLNALKQAGLVHARRESRQIIYSVNFARMTDLIGFLTESCCAAEGKSARATATIRRELRAIAGGRS
jgi:DNA-binding transcriptional ArsR family regulator